jgi:competence protein ComGC
MYRQRLAFMREELLLVAMLLAILAIVATPEIARSSSSARTRRSCQFSVSWINKQADLHFIRTGVWPQDLSKFVTNTEYFKAGVPSCPFGLAYSANSDTHHVSPHSH